MNGVVLCASAAESLEGRTLELLLFVEMLNSLIELCVIYSAKNYKKNESLVSEPEIKEINHETVVFLVSTNSKLSIATRRQ